MPSHETLWTPWRARWVGEASKGQTKCPFCIAEDEEPSVENLVVHRNATGLAMMNLYPYNGGHVLVVPRRHVPRLRDLRPSEHSDLVQLIVLAQDVLDRTHRPNGFNVGINEGRTAGAGIPEHLHWHVVPRWDSDASFMTTVAGTRIVPEDMASCWSRVREGFKAL